MLSDQFYEKTKNTLVVGGGPLGLVYALFLKQLNPNAEVTVLEKYEKYTRNHTLVMDYHQLEKLLTATQSLKNSPLYDLVKRLKKDPHIRTSDLQKIVADLARKNGVQIRHEELKQKTFEEQINLYQPTFIVGADGTHSTVSQCLFPEGNQVKIEFDYVLQLRMEVIGGKKADKVNFLTFTQDMARYGMIANEYVGHFDEVTKRTPITMQMMISKDAFKRLKDATSKRPIKPFFEREEKSEIPDDENNISNLRLEDIPEDVRAYLNNYLTRKIKTTLTKDQHLDGNSITISVNEAPATYAKEVYRDWTDAKGKKIPVFLGGDAGLGLSYFKGLNAGIESAAQFFSFLTQSSFYAGLKEYSNWFLTKFAPNKIKEVEKYSTWQIRPPMKIMQAARNIKESSMVEDLHGDDNLLIDYFKLIATDPQQELVIGEKLYPHRNHDPVKLGQFEYVPIQHTLKKITKLFIDYFKPYKSTTQLKQNFQQPLVGGINSTVGVFKILVGLFTLNAKRFVDGCATLLRGLIEMATFPLAWFIKPLTRGLITTFKNKPDAETNKGIQKIAKQGAQLLEVLKDKLQRPENKYQLLAMANDLHRKFDKSIGRGQHTKIALQEQAAFTEIRANVKDVNEAQFIKYFSLFTNAKHPGGVQPVQESPRLQI